MSDLLTITDLSKQFGGLMAVRNFAAIIEKGETVALLGPNGSGKTTVLNMISGALMPTQGSILLTGNQLSGQKPHHIAKYGVARTFQLVKVLGSLSVLENVVVSLVFGKSKLWGKPAEKIAMQKLEMVGLASVAHKNVGELNYIDQKRLELARAIACEPSLLLLDEWLAGLNPDELQDGIALIKALKTDDMTIILVEHIMDAVHALCGRAIVMSAGRIIADGPTADALNEPEVVRAYLGEDHA